MQRGFLSLVLLKHPTLILIRPSLEDVGTTPCAGETADSTPNVVVLGVSHGHRYSQPMIRDTPATGLAGNSLLAVTIGLQLAPQVPHCYCLI